MDPYSDTDNLKFVAEVEDLVAKGHYVQAAKKIIIRCARSTDQGSGFMPRLQLTYETNSELRDNLHLIVEQLPSAEKEKVKRILSFRGWR